METQMRIEEAMATFWLQRKVARAEKHKSIATATYYIKRTQKWDISKWTQKQVLQHLDSTLSSICYAWGEDGSSDFDVRVHHTPKGLELFFGPKGDASRTILLQCRGTPKKPKIVFTWQFNKEPA